MLAAITFFAAGSHFIAMCESHGPDCYRVGVIEEHFISSSHTTENN